MEFRTAYDLTLSMAAGRVLVKKLVEYNDLMLEGMARPPAVFEVPGVLRLENVAVIESHEYETVPNPVFKFIPRSIFTDCVGRQYPGRKEPRERAWTEEDSLRVRFVVWQRSPENL